MRKWIRLFAERSSAAVGVFAKWLVSFTPLVRFFGLVSFSAVLGACIYVWGWGLSGRLVAEPPAILSDAPRPPKDIWFSPSGALLVSEEVGGQLYLTKWMETSKGWKSHRTNTGIRSESPVYAISVDGESLAWICKGRLCTSGIKSSVRPQVRSIGLTQEIVSLSFTGKDLLALVLRDSSVKFYNLRSGKKLRAGFRILVPGASVRIPSSVRIPWAVSLSQESIIFVSAFPYRFVACAEILNDIKVYHKKRIVPAQDVLSLAVNGCDLMAAGTGDGMVAILRPGGDDKGVYAPPMRPVRSLAFYDEETVLAAGDFPGIYAITGSSSYKVVESNLVSDFSLQRRHLAYFDSRLMLTRLSLEPELNRYGALISLIVSVFVSFVALVFSLTQEHVKRRGNS